MKHEVLIRRDSSRLTTTLTHPQTVSSHLCSSSSHRKAQSRGDSHHQLLCRRAGRNGTLRTMKKNLAALVLTLAALTTAEPVEDIFKIFIFVLLSRWKLTEFVFLFPELVEDEQRHFILIFIFLVFLVFLVLLHGKIRWGLIQVWFRAGGCTDIHCWNYWRVWCHWSGGGCLNGGSSIPSLTTGEHMLCLCPDGFEGTHCEQGQGLTSWSPGFLVFPWIWPGHLLFDFS